MKKDLLLFIATLSFIMLSSCSQDAQEEKDENTMVPVTVQVNGFVISQDDIPSNRATAVSDYNNVKFLTLAFYKVSDGSQAYKYTQSRSDNTSYTTFGEFALSLPFGSYTMVVIANAGNDAVSLTNATLASYGENNVKDTFVATQVVNITSGSSVNLTATLDRIVAALSVQSTDNRPADVTQMRFTYSKGGKSFDPTTGRATSDAGFVTTMTYSGAAGSTTKTGGYLFLAEDEETVNVTIETLNADDDVLFSKTINNVPLKRNRITTLTGAVYTNSGITAGSFKVNDSWLTAYNMDL